MLDIFRLNEDPFARVPCGRFTFQAEPFRDARNRLLDHFERGDPAVVLVGPSGIGKTVLLQHFAEHLTARGWNVLWPDPAAGFGVAEPECAALASAGRAFAAAPTRQAQAVFIDDAGDLTDRELRRACLTVGLGPDGGSPAVLLLAGTEILLETLLRAAPGVSFHVVRLRAMAAGEVGEYVRHRLQVAGAAGTDVFSAPALEALAEYSRGIPGTVSRISVAALLLAQLEARPRVDIDLVHEAAGDLGFLEGQAPRSFVSGVAAHPPPAATPTAIGAGPAPTLAESAKPPAADVAGGSPAASERSGGPTPGARRVRLILALAAFAAVVVPSSLLPWPSGETEPTNMAAHPLPIGVAGDVGDALPSQVAGQAGLLAATPPGAPETLAGDTHAAVVPDLVEFAGASVSPSSAGEPAAGLVESLARGDELAALGDIASARLHYEFALRHGNPDAAGRLARTYDPVFLRNPRVSGLRPDAQKAAALYRMAAAAGDAEAALRHAALVAGPALAVPE